MMSRFPTHRALLALLALLAGCTTTSLKQAPIVDRSERRTAPTAGIAAAPGVSAPREARDGSYVVQRGDTLFSIALAFGLDYRDLARWNNLDDPSRLQVGQALRVQPPADSPGGAAVAAVPVAPVPAAEVRPLDAPQGSTTPAAPAGATGPGSIGSAPSVAPAAGVPSAQIPVPEVKPAAPAIADSGLTWIWPVSGKIVEGFDESRNKGIDIAGNEGDPVHAAGDGQVVYRGNGLRGYGNLVIIKHTDEFISAYAHNRQILVEQGQTVKRGQRIAEMGKSDADAPKLHFEVRRQGKPVDPLRYLPAR
jgi:lipoprotein NlpD